MSSLLIRGGTILTMNDRLDTLTGDVVIRNGRIESVSPGAGVACDQTIDASGALVLPGFVQTHIHLCQTLFRGFADDLKLMEWLRLRVWPMEAAHTAASLRVAARLAASELLATGTTTVLTMETVHDTDAVFEAIAEVGIRAVIGKCLMDADSLAPKRLYQPTREAIDESLSLRKRWQGAAGGRISAAFAPRFALSCSRELLEEVGSLSAQQDIIVHTHASEQQDEIALVEQNTGRRNMHYFAETGLLSPRLCVAHCIWVDESEQAAMAEHDVKVLHCPGSNMKLGSGIAPVPELRRRGISVSLGADGAACNNRLNMFDEMRLAATLQALRVGPGVLTARDVVWMATREGARALGLEREIGSIEAGKRADLIVVDTQQPPLVPGPDPYSTLVYATRGTDVRTTIVDGQVLVDGHILQHIDETALVRAARAEALALAARAGF
jgi:5-methylthioadenosine/S-adenosylhomocysteine deaminase